MATENRLYISCDTSAVSLGADEVADAIKKSIPDCSIIRTGSRGMVWAEPLVEVEVDGERIAYGPIDQGEVDGLLKSDFLSGGAHPKYLGKTDDIPYFKNQHRITFARCGLYDPISLKDYESLGGLKGLRHALTLDPQAIVDAVKRSGLRGRGGAGFPTGIKWQTVLDAKADQKYIACNADEGDSGTFSDRMLMEGDPYALLEGIIIAGLATGATKGYIYLRSEYPLAKRTLIQAIASMKDAGWLGSNIGGSEQSFDIIVRIGAGAYICGEETSMLESLEGKRGQVRAKPPLPALEGLFGSPTVVNNVISLASIPSIVAENGAETYAGLGVDRSKGTLPFQLAGNIKRGGLVEVPFGLTLRELIDDFGGGTRSGRPVHAVQVGGPLGAYFPATMLDTRLDYEEFAAHQGLVGHGGIVVFDDSVDMAQQARFSMEFCAIESCGKCTPCRIGSTRGVETIDKIVAGIERDKNLGILNDLCDLMESASLCALGGLTPLPVKSALKYFPDDFDKAAK